MLYYVILFMLCSATIACPPLAIITIAGIVVLVSTRRGKVKELKRCEKVFYSQVAENQRIKNLMAF